MEGLKNKALVVKLMVWKKLFQKNIFIKVKLSI